MWCILVLSTLEAAYVFNVSPFLCSRKAKGSSYADPAEFYDIGAEPLLAARCQADILEGPSGPKATPSGPKATPSGPKATPSGPKAAPPFHYRQCPRTYS
jgi:hypothetical protein